MLGGASFSTTFATAPLLLEARSRIFAMSPESVADSTSASAEITAELAINDEKALRTSALQAIRSILWVLTVFERLLKGFIGI